MLSAVGRMPGIPAEWVVEQTDAGLFVAVPPEACGRGSAADEREEERVCDLRRAIVTVLSAERDLTADDIWNRLPPDVRVNEKRFGSVLVAENGKLWVRKGGGNRPLIYSLKLEAADLRAGGG